MDGQRAQNLRTPLDWQPCSLEGKPHAVGSKNPQQGRSIIETKGLRVQTVWNNAAAQVLPSNASHRND